MSGRDNRKTSVAAARKGKRDPWLQSESENLTQQRICSNNYKQGNILLHVFQLDNFFDSEQKLY